MTGTNTSSHKDPQANIDVWRRIVLRIPAMPAKQCFIQQTPQTWPPINCAATGVAWRNVRNSSQFVVREKDEYIAKVFLADIQDRAGIRFLHVHSSSCSLVTFARTIGCSTSDPKLPHKRTDRTGTPLYSFLGRNKKSKAYLFPRWQDFDTTLFQCYSLYKFFKKG